MNMKHWMAAAALIALAACGQTQTTSPEATAPAQSEAPLEIKAPAGTYALDPTHTSVVFRVNHLGLSNYTARFAETSGTLTFDPANPAAMQVTATINPASVRTDYSGDYKASHADSPYASWDEDLARNPDWMDAGTHPVITFTSTSVEPTGPRTAKVTGDLTFRGVTAPVTLDVTFNGELSPHPFLNGRSAVGFSARGTLDRTAFGMTNYVPNIGQQVELVIETEFHQQEA